MGDAWVATADRGLWHSDVDELAHWQRVPDLPANGGLYALVGPPTVAGGHGAIWVEVEGRWTRRPLPDRDVQVWALARDPHAPATLYAGCRPLALFRSLDAGLTWESLPLTLPADTPRPHTPRVTSILVDGGTLRCGVEIGGVFVSEDGGKHWAPDNDGLPSLDIHALTRTPDGTVVAALPLGVAHREGGGWRSSAFALPWRYCRTLVQADRQLLCGFGDGPPGGRGAVAISEDNGRSWHSALFPGMAGSTVWSLAVAGNTALAGAIGGELFASDDAGRMWRRLAQALGEIRAVLVT